MIHIYRWHSCYVENDKRKATLTTWHSFYVEGGDLCWSHSAEVVNHNMNYCSYSNIVVHLNKTTTIHTKHMTRRSEYLHITYLSLSHSDENTEHNSMHLCNYTLQVQLYANSSLPEIFMTYIQTWRSEYLFYMHQIISLQISSY